MFVIGIKLIYHRAKQVGSLFQGHWGKGEGREAIPPWGVKPPLKVAKQPLLCCGVTLRCHHRSPLDLGPPLVYANMVANRGLHYFMSKAVFQDSFGKEEVAK